MIFHQSISLKNVIPSHSLLEICRSELRGSNGVRYFGYLITFFLFVKCAFNFFNQVLLLAPVYIKFFVKSS